MWETKANFNILLFTVHYLLNTVFWLGAVGKPDLREVKHGREGFEEKWSV